MSTDFDRNTRLPSRRLADLQSKRADLERELSANQMSLDYELTQLTYGDEAEPEPDETYWYEVDEPAYGGADALADEADHVEFTAHAGYGQHGDYADRGDFEDRRYDEPDEVEPPGPYRELGDPGQRAQPTGRAPAGGGRTETLLRQGRRSSYTRGLSGRVKVAAGGGLAAVIIAVAVMLLSGGGASWPASVTAVQGAVTQACRNPDIASEPGQVNFACGADTRPILWVFALVASHDNPRFSDPRTGRIGLEPITPTQGAVVAWSLNLHHPYRPTNPVDSVAVAARAVNNIIGGATVTSASGSPVIQPGLESSAANCLRYTGSAALTSRAGFPSQCARPVTSASGQAALVADIYRKWFVGGSAQTAQDAAVLFRNAKNPGDPQVQAILRRLSASSGAA